MARFIVLFLVVAVCCAYAMSQRVVDCGPNEVFVTCGVGRDCEQTCQSQGPKACPMMCHRGCECQQGYVRRVEGGECILPQDCPRRANLG